MDRCAYCGEIVAKGAGKTRDHVFPRSLYPVSRRRTCVPITVPACEACNRRWTDDEEHFRNVVNSAGDFNAPAAELFADKIRRSLRRQPGERRILDLLRISEAVEVDGQPRLRIYPARDPRVLGVLRKIVVGLCHHHGFITGLGEERIWVDVLRFGLPNEYLARLHHEEREADIVEYWYGVHTEPGVHSVWILRFYGRTTFVALVSAFEDGRLPWAREADGTPG